MVDIGTLLLLTRLIWLTLVRYCCLPGWYGWHWYIIVAYLVDMIDIGTLLLLTWLIWLTLVRYCCLPGWYGWHWYVIVAYLVDIGTLLLLTWLIWWMSVRKTMRPSGPSLKLMMGPYCLITLSISRWGVRRLSRWMLPTKGTDKGPGGYFST